jgi:hypothetical protein
MAKFFFWYKRVVEAPSLVSAIKKEKKVELKFDSINEEDVHDLTPCIGFQTDTEDDFDEED